MLKQKPIERTFPINQVNEIAEREAHAKRYYRPIYTMHKWWARRLGSVFRAIAMYSLLDDESAMDIGEDVQGDLLYFEKDQTARLWNLYLKDVKLQDNRIVLDPMMGGGTSIVEALRLGAKVIGCDINPVAWFVVKKEIEPADLQELQDAYKQLQQKVAPDILRFYRTSCPVCDHEADAMYYFWVKELPCVNCGQTVPLFKSHRIAASRSARVEHHLHVHCASCGHYFAPTEDATACPACGAEFRHEPYSHVMCAHCGQFFEASDLRDRHKCPRCGAAAVPTAANARDEYYTCPACAQKYEIIQAVAQFGRPPLRLYGVEYYCRECDRKGYKQADDTDLALYDSAAAQLAAAEAALPIPRQSVPPGLKTKELLNHGYSGFREMFNQRQLLCLGLLLKAVMELEDDNIREHILLAFSQTLEPNNMFARYNVGANKIEGLFATHAYAPKTDPVENNVWGTEYGRGTFSKEFELLLEGKRFAVEPFEKYVDSSGKTREKRGFEPIRVNLTDSYEALGHGGNALLYCRSADYLPLNDDQQVDLILTDPPYYDNVMYSELSDFFYVWLRLALKDQYPHFQAGLTPKAKEVIVNPSRAGKSTEEDFLRDLRSVFTESYRLLKDDGLIVFTYHHRKDEAWSAVLGAILDAGFYVTAAWPVHSEMSGSTHIYDQKNISYDTIIVARKRQREGERISWHNLEDQIYARAADIVRFYVHEDGKYVSDPDMGVIAQAKCLELYSQHYPNVMEGGEPVSVQEAVKRTTDIVTEQLIEERFQALTAETDTLSALYLLFVADRDTITYNTLDKWLRGRGADVEDFVDHDLLRQEGNVLRVTKPEARTSHVESTSRPLAVDGAHYLHSVIEHGDLEAQARRWADRRTIAAAKELHKVTGDDDYERIAQYLERLVL